MSKYWESVGGKRTGGSKYWSSGPRSQFSYTSEYAGTPKKKGGGFGRLLGIPFSDRLIDVVGSVTPDVIERIPADFLRGAKQAAVQAVPGIYHMGKSVVEDIIENPESLYFGPSAPIAAVMMGEIGPGKSHFIHETAIPMGEGMLTTARHPLRDPFQTFTLGLAAVNPAIGGAMRASAGFRALAQVTEGGSKLKAFAVGSAKKPVYVTVRTVTDDTGAVTKVREPNRILTHPDDPEFTVEAQAFRSPVGIAAQKLMDKARERFPDSRTLSPVHGGLRQKMIVERSRNIAAELARAEAPAAELLVAGKSLSPAEQVALWMVEISDNPKRIGPRITVAKVKERFQAWIDEGTGNTEGHQRWLDLVDEAEPLLIDMPTGIKIRKGATELRQVYDKYKSVREARETIVGEKLNLLSPEAMAIRRSATGQMILYGRILDPDEMNPQLRMFDEGLEPVEQIPDIYGGGHRVPERAVKAKGGQRTKEYTGEFRPPPSTREWVPGSLTHDYTGRLLENGMLDPVFTRFMAESITEAERFAALLRSRGELTRFAKRTHDPSNPNEIPIDMSVFEELPPALKNIQAKLQRGEKLTPEESQTLGWAFESVQSRLFPTRDLKAFDYKDLPEHYFYIDKRSIGELHKPSPWIKSAQLGKVGPLFDVVNDASRIAFILGKPGYVPANLLGNVAMNLIQQGFAAPFNLWRSSVLFRQLTKAEAAAIDRVMGLGITSLMETSLRGKGIAGKVHYASVKGSGGAAWVIDRLPRRASFLHEAHKAGYRNKAAVRRLVEAADEETAAALTRVTRQAREAIGDYERLGPVEKGVVKRIIFFYPWLKVSSRMTGRSIMEYPYKAAAVAQLGEQGARYQRELFGLEKMPPGLEGLIPLWGEKGSPVAFDPRSVGIWATPAEIGEAFLQLNRGDAPVSLDLHNFGTPFVSALISAMTRRNAFSGTPSNLPPTDIFFNEMFGGIPSVNWVKRQFGYDTPEDRVDRLYPQRGYYDPTWQFLTSGYRGVPNRARLEELLG